MFNFLFPTEPFGGQTLRLVAQAQQGGGDLFDIARTCRNIQAGDKQSWEKAWLELAQSTKARAEEALSAGRKSTARDYFSTPISITECPMCFSRIKRMTA